MMSASISFSVDLTLTALQIELLNDISNRYEQSATYQYLDREYGMESLTLMSSNDGNHWFGDVKCPNTFDYEELNDFIILILQWLSELKCSRGGKNWKVCLADSELIEWDEATKSYRYPSL